MVMNTETRWTPSIHRFGHKFDHDIFSDHHVTLTNKKHRTDSKVGFWGHGRAALVGFWLWRDLRIRIEASEQARYETTYPAVDKMQEAKVNEELQDEYAHLTSLVRESIEAVGIPSASKNLDEKKWQNSIRDNKDTVRSKNKTIPRGVTRYS